jgi:hypothetical protein
MQIVIAVDVSLLAEKLERSRDGLWFFVMPS